MVSGRCVVIDIELVAVAILDGVGYDYCRRVIMGHHSPSPIDYCFADGRAECGIVVAAFAFLVMLVHLVLLPWYLEFAVSHCTSAYM